MRWCIDGCVWHPDAGEEFLMANMESRRATMKSALAENLRVLMTRKMYEKITIKQICDETGVIRATFYNYFDDKYDCLN